MEMTFYQIAVDGKEPSGPLFETRKDAEWEVQYMRSDDLEYQNEAMMEAGIHVDIPRYEIHQVTRTMSPAYAKRAAATAA